MIKIVKLGKFDQMLDELYSENEDIRDQIEENILLFKKNPDDTRLDNHLLTKRMEGKWAFSITDDIRVVYQWLGKTTVRFLAIGGHRKAYRRKKGVD